MYKNALASVVVLAAASPVLAHGLQFQITYDQAAQKIVTRQLIAGSASLTSVGYPTATQAQISPETRVYVMPLALTNVTAGTGWYSRPSPLESSPGVPTFPSGPGVAWQYDTTATVPGTFVGTPTPIAGTGWALNGVDSGPQLVNLTGTRFGFKFEDSLKVWNGSALIDPGDEQLQAFAGDATGAFTGSTPNAITTDVGAGPSFVPVNPIGTTWSNGPHNSTSYRILGNGVDSSSVEPDDGIYVAKFSITSTALIPGTSTPIGGSEPAYFVMYKGSTLEEALAVANTLGVSPSQIQAAAVPEPSAVAAFVATAAAMLARRRRN